MITTYHKIDYTIFIYTLFLGVFLYDWACNSLGFTYIDELISLTLLMYWGICGKRRSKEFFIFICFALFFLCYSLIRPHNVTAAILTDFIIQVKPFVAFYCVRNLRFVFTKKEARKICRLCIVLTILMIPIGILNLITDGAYYNLFLHARFATAAIILGLVYYFFSSRTRKDLLIATLIFTVGLLSTRTKMFGFYALYIGVMYLSNTLFNPQKRFPIIKATFLACIVILGVLYFSWNKISFYFIQGGVEATEEIFARPMLYIGMVDILKDYPLLGSGLGSFATFASAAHYSPLYYQYGLDQTFGLTEDAPNFASDTFFPVMAQIGIFGFLLYFFFFRKRLKEGIIRYKKYGDTLYLKYTILIIGFFIIESVADSTFTQNRGMVMMMFWGIMANHAKYSNDKVQCQSNNIQAIN